MSGRPMRAAETANPLMNVNAKPACWTSCAESASKQQGITWSFGSRNSERRFSTGETATAMAPPIYPIAHTILIATSGALRFLRLGRDEMRKRHAAFTGCRADTQRCSCETYTRHLLQGMREITEICGQAVRANSARYADNQELILFCVMSSRTRLPTL